VEMTPAVYLL